MFLQACPLPLERVADEVAEITAAHEWASFQSEYGISMAKWLDDNNCQARKMLDRWWLALPAAKQRDWLVRYRKEVADEIERMKLDLAHLDGLLKKDNTHAHEEETPGRRATAEGPQTQVPG